MNAQTFDDHNLVFLSPWDGETIALAIAIAATAWLVSLWSYRRQRLWAASLLVLLRLLSIGAILLSVLQPALRTQNVTRVPNRIALVVDGSASMSVRPRQTEPSRIQRVEAILKASAARLDKWREDRAVDRYAFGSKLVALADSDPLSAEQSATRFRQALLRLKRRYQQQRLAGVVLFSDGHDNDRAPFLTRELEQILRDFGAPIHSVFAGGKGLTDIAIGEVFADDFAFVRNAVNVEAEVLIVGAELQPVVVELLRGKERLASATIAPQRGKSAYRVRFEFVPKEVGEYLLTIASPPLPGEATTANNRRSFVMRVVRDRIRVLQLCGRPSWDERFLRGWLKRNPNVDLISFFILRTPASLALVPPSELSLIPFPTKELFEKELGSFDLVILQNFDFAPYGIGVYLQRLRRYVEQGGGLMLLGGDQAIKNYAGTPVGAVLPVVVPQTPASNAETFRPRLTERGRQHPATQYLASITNGALPSHLPELEGINRIAGLAEGAVALAVHPRLKLANGQPEPLIAVREVERGRTMSVTTDSLWLWAFPERDESVARAAYDRFWRDAVRWLIHDPELRYLRIVTPTKKVRPSAPLAVEIRAYHTDYQPYASLAIDYQLARADQSDTQPIKIGKLTTDAAGRAPLPLVVEAPGAYQISVTATIDGRQTVDRALFVVEPINAELRDIRARPGLLRKISHETGGQFFEQIAELPELSFRPPRVSRVNWRRDHELWNRWWWLAAALTLLTLEWLVRRRFGYL